MKKDEPLGLVTSIADHLPPQILKNPAAPLLLVICRHLYQCFLFCFFLEGVRLVWLRLFLCLAAEIF